MRKRNKIRKLTGSYQDWLISSLRDRNEAAAYLQMAMEEYQKDGNTKALLLALRDVAEAQGGLGNLSRKTHLNRESLYKTLSSRGNPKLQTLGLVLHGLGFQLLIKPA